MAFFKFRKGTEASAAAAANPQESIETMRRRAKHRLLGATVLVLAAVIGFPILFETQPRPVAVDIPIDIPDKNKVKPLLMPSAAAKPAALASAAGMVDAAPKTPSLSASAVPAKAAAAQAAASVAKASVVPAAASVGGKEEIVPDKPTAKTEPKRDATLEAKAPSDGKEAVAGEARFIVQVGAFAEADRVRDVRQKLERAGLKTYAQVIETKDGKRTRVRVGPFASRVQAEQAVEKIKAIDLPAAILSL